MTTTTPRAATPLLIRQPLMELLPQIEAVVFDVDGVLVDVSGTFRVVICEVAQVYAEQRLSLDRSARLIAPEETSLFKDAGGFNNDWDLTMAVILLYLAKSLRHGCVRVQELRRHSPTLVEFTAEINRRGGGLGPAEEILVHDLTPEQRRQVNLLWDRKLIVQMFQEVYAGTEHCEQLYGFVPEHFPGPGYVDKERILIDRELLTGQRRYGLLTGRTLEETRLAVSRAGLESAIPQAHWVTHDDGVRKPDGRALWTVVDRMNFRLGLYLGDTLDDLQTVVNYRSLRGSHRARILPAMVLSGCDTRENARFLERGAEIVTPDANALMSYLNSAQAQYRSGRRG